MPVKYLTDQLSYPAWAGERYKKLDKFQRFLDGTIYEGLRYAFSDEYENGTQKYIPLRERRPSVIYNLPRIIVNRSTRLLFGGKHFPKLLTSDASTVGFLQSLVETSNLQAAMLETAFVGSIGSVAVFFCVYEGKFFYEIHNPRCCMPIFDAQRELEEVFIMYVLLGYDLKSAGYAIAPEDIQREFFFAKRFTKLEEIRYQPLKVEEFEDESSFTIDPNRSSRHNFGFVPGVWIKNLWPTYGVDGECTFSQILSVSVEIDYQLSQCGRGLKYNSDPQLLVKEPPGSPDQGPTVRSASNALFVGEDGDAKLLEISGQGQKAVLEYVKQLRQYSFEVASSSQKDPETSYGNMSGRAMEILEGELIGLAAGLRLTYGEMGLKPLLVKILRAAASLGLIASDPTKVKDFNLELYWGNWFDPTPVDLQQTETALSLALNGRRLYPAEARMLSASVWGVGNTDPKQLEERWPIPEVVEGVNDGNIRPTPETRLRTGGVAAVGAGGSDGRDAKVSS